MERDGGRETQIGRQRWRRWRWTEIRRKKCGWETSRSGDKSNRQRLAVDRVYNREIRDKLIVFS